MNERQALAVLTELAPTYDAHGEELRAARARVDSVIAAERTAPARGWHRPRARWLVAAAGVAAVATGGVLWPSGTSGAYASWTAEPTRATADQVQAARTDCDRATAGALADVTGPRPHSPSSAAELAGQQVKLSEQRGDATLVVTANATWLQACLVALPVSPALTEIASVDLRRHATAVPPSDVDVLSAQSEGTDHVSVAIVVGRVGSEVAGVRITTSDGRDVHAQLSGGYWSAWWPTAPGGQLLPADVVALRPDGTSHDVGTIADLLAGA